MKAECGIRDIVRSRGLGNVYKRRGKGDLQKRASLLRRDSVHGPFSGTIAVDEENDAIIANGNYIKTIYANDPSAIYSTPYGIDHDPATYTNLTHSNDLR